MHPVIAALFLALWLLGVGLVAVYFEVECVNTGVRVRDLHQEEARLVEDLRRREMLYNGLVSPDVLERKLPPELRGPTWEGDGAGAPAGDEGAADERLAAGPGAVGP